MKLPCRQMKFFRWTALVVLATATTLGNPSLGRSATPEEENTRGEQNSRRYCRALPGYQFEFPRDHFSHPCYKV
ncbi:MAG: hypothetical protein O7A06_00800, partial [Acidobacteria bacterium]|nr:hypothetical protein [Acidobacteriota bacterium]